MKQILSLILCLSLILSISGCGNSTEVSPTEENKGTSTPTESTQATTTTATEPPLTEPAEPDFEDCPHNYEATARKESTCTEAGYIDYTCKICGICEAVELAPNGHILLDATCTAPKTCRVCGTTQGAAPGHKYVNNQCVRCGHTQVSDTPECSHDFQMKDQTLPGCTQNGNITYTCRHCGYSYNQGINAVGHSFADATCLAAKKCIICGITSGNPLGHSYGNNSLCVRCGAKNPNTPTDNPKPPPQDTDKPTQSSNFTLTIRAKNSPIANITVTVYVDTSTTPAGSTRTDASGKAIIPLTPGTQYNVVLSDVPSGYKHQDRYTFYNLTANINLTLMPVLDSNDHSRAQYEVGSTMADFTLKDTDGNTYTLSQLLKTKNTVILNFWFVNCSPCRQEFPHFEELYKLYRDDVQLLTLNHFDSEASIKQLKKDMGLTFPMIYENIGMQKGFGLIAYPTTVVIGQGMEILEIHEGSYTYEEALALFETYAN